MKFIQTMLVLLVSLSLANSARAQCFDNEFHFLPDNGLFGYGNGLGNAFDVSGDWMIVSFHGYSESQGAGIYLGAVDFLKKQADGTWLSTQTVVTEAIRQPFVETQLRLSLIHI